MAKFVTIKTDVGGHRVINVDAISGAYLCRDGSTTFCFPDGTRDSGTVVDPKQHDLGAEWTRDATVVPAQPGYTALKISKVTSPTKEFTLEHYPIVAWSVDALSPAAPSPVFPNGCCFGQTPESHYDAIERPDGIVVARGGDIYSSRDLWLSEEAVTRDGYKRLSWPYDGTDDDIVADAPAPSESKSTKAKADYKPPAKRAPSKIMAAKVEAAKAALNAPAKSLPLAMDRGPFD